MGVGELAHPQVRRPLSGLFASWALSVRGRASSVARRSIWS
jgi:hypothetical protein